MKNSLTPYVTGLLLTLAHFSPGQTFYSIKANVVNTRQEPIPVDARLLTLPDSVLLRSGTFPDGVVSFTAVPTGRAILRLTGFSIRDTVISISNDDRQTLDLGEIVMRDIDFQLDEVNITRQAPLVRESNDGNKQLQVAGTILAGSTSLTQVLERSPGVAFIDGRIHVIGKGEALILLNNQAITYEQMNAIPVSQIVRIEVISSPSSKYDAEGKGIIRIITKANAAAGSTGSLTHQFAYSKFAGMESNSLAELTHRKGRLTMISNYALRTGNDREILHTTRTRPEIANYLQSDLTTNWQRKLKNYSVWGLGLQYDISKNTYFSVGYKGNLDKLGGSQLSLNTIKNAAGNGVYNSLIAENEKRLNHSFILNYNRTLDSIGSSLFVGSQFARFQTVGHDLIHENNVINDSSFSRKIKNDMSYQISISSTQADYSKVFVNGQKLESGIKIAYANTSSSTDFLVSVSEAKFLPDPKLSSRFDYHELIPAVYFSLSGNIGKGFRYGGGIRGEWTRYQLNTSAGTGQSLQKGYLNVFPNLLLTKTINPEFNVRLSYVSKITRPRYQALNPWVIYQDPFTSIQGNPALVAERVHSFEAGLNYRRSDLRAGYNFTRDPISGAALRGDTPSSYVLKSINLEKDHTFFITASTSMTVAWWNTTNTLTVSQSNSIDNQYGFKLVSPRPQLYAYTSNSFNVNGLFKIQLIAWYLGAKYYGLYYNKNRSTVTLGLEKDFFKNAWKLRLTANDIFHKTNAAGTYTVGETDIVFDRTYNTSWFNVSLSYRFGKLLKEVYKSKSTADSEQGRAR